MKKIYKTIRNWIWRALDDYFTIHAAYSALFIFMSVFPLAMFIIAFLTKLNVSREYLLEQFYNITPVVFHEFIREIIESTAKASTTFVFSFSIIALVWSASSGVYGLMLGLNDVYRTYDTRSYVKQRSLSIFYMFFIVIAVGLSLFLLVFGNRLLDLALVKFPTLKPVWDWVQLLRYPVTFIVLMFVFNLMYFVFPHMKSKFFMHAPGAAFTALGWLLLSYFFSLYLNSVEDFTMYGSLAMVVMFLFWLWIAMCIVFLGGEINAMIMDAKYGVRTNPIRQQNLTRIEKIEAELRKKNDLSATARFNLRKSTTRQLDTRLIQEEWKKSKEEEEEKLRLWEEENERAEKELQLKKAETEKAKKRSEAEKQQAAFERELLGEEVTKESFPIQ